MANHSNGEVALEHAATGLFVFPVNSQKIPCETGWQTSASNDRAAVEALWRKWPNALVGISCGPSGIVVVDCDRHGGPDGVAAFNELAGNGAYEPLVYTPGDGLHVYFLQRDDEWFGNGRGRLPLGIDIRGDGGFVIAPGSRLPDGREYRCDRFDLGRASVLPEVIAVLLRKPKPRQHHDAGVARCVPFGREQYYAEAALSNAVRDLARVETGGRNCALNITALKLAHMVASGWIDRGRVANALLAACQSNGLISDDGEAAVRATIESAFRKGLSEPHPPLAGQDGPPPDNAASGDRPDNDDGTDLSHDALANDLGRRGWNKDARYVAAWNKWLFWNGLCWKLDEQLVHITRIRCYLTRRAEELAKWAERKGASFDAKEAEALTKWAEHEGRILRSKGTVANIAELARSNAASVSVPTAFDSNLLLLGTPGGVVDLRTGVLRPAKREDMPTKQTLVAPTQSDSSPRRWLQFLEEVFAGDVAVIEFMQRAVGYALTGCTSEHKLLFLYGTGRNGKSVFLDVLTRLWGDYARRAAAATFLNSQTERHPTDIAGLQGARLVVGSELPKGKTWDEAVIKDLTGGDRMTARFMRQDYFDFTPQLTLMIAGNTQPSFRGVDEAIRSRVVLVPFTVTIPPEKRDRDLVAKLIAEGPAILRWAIDGALEWQKRGLDVPAAIAAASAEYFDSEDTLGQFIGDEIEPKVGAFTSAQDLHQRFEQWAGRQGLVPWSQLTVLKEVRARGFGDAKSHGRRGLRGFVLR